MYFGHPVILDILHFEAEWIEWINYSDFVEQRPLIRTYRGSNRSPGVLKNNLRFYVQSLDKKHAHLLNLEYSDS